jgi:hypothetical protein
MRWWPMNARRAERVPDPADGGVVADLADGGVGKISQGGGGGDLADGGVDEQGR